MRFKKIRAAALVTSLSLAALFPSTPANATPSKYGCWHAFTVYDKFEGSGEATSYCPPDAPVYHMLIMTCVDDYFGSWYTVRSSWTLPGEYVSNTCDPGDLARESGIAFMGE